MHRPHCVNKSDPTWGFVQIWSTNQANAVAEIDIKANVCCAKYNPESMYEIAVGAADHTVLTYDLRKSDKAVHTFKGGPHLHPHMQRLPTTPPCLPHCPFLSLRDLPPGRPPTHT